MRKITDKKELIKLCSFIIMGNGGVYKGKKNYKFIMNTLKKNLDFVEYCRDILGNITTASIKDRKDYNTDGYNRKPQVRLETSTHPIFTKLRERIYTDNYKGIDPHILKLLDWESLAILYMSDGSLYSYKRENIGMKRYSHKVSLNLKRLSYGDLFILKKFLKEKLCLEWNINRQNQYYYLVLRTKDIKAFMANIKPYILPSFSYKLLDESFSEGKAGDNEIV